MPPYTAPQTKNILIIGSTGVIGTYITRAIVDARESFDRICVLTSQKTFVEKIQDIAALEAWGVEIFTGRLESETAVKRAYEGMLHVARGSCSKHAETNYRRGLHRFWMLQADMHSKHQASTRLYPVLVGLALRNRST